MDYIYTILFTCLVFLSVSDSTLIWRINVNPPAYLLGTAHLPHPLIWPSLSDTAKSAFYNSTHFLPEFDITNFFSFTRFRMCMNSPVAPNGPPASATSTQYGSSSSILDVYLTLEARRLKKTVIGLETVEMYCEFTKFQLDTLVSNITSDTHRPPPPSSSSNVNEYDQVKHAYNCDMNFPGELFPPTPMNFMDSTMFAFQQRLEELVGRRDTKMAEKIDGLLREQSPDKRYFFAVGFIHLMGADGIVAKLKQDYQYSITRLCSDAPDFRATLGCQGPSWCDRIPGL